MKIILLNAPPSGGKDTFAGELMRRYPAFRHEKFSRPLKDGGSAALAIDLAVLESTYKDIVIPGLDKTWREYQISMSETWYKPAFGVDVFGRLLARRVSTEGTPYWVVSDSGFVPETEAVMEFFGPESVIAIRIHREGCDFSQDSRGWLPDELGITTIDVNNNGEMVAMLEEAEEQLGDALLV